MAGFAKDFRELEVYREAREAAKRVFEITKKFPREETYAVTDQIRRASRSVGAHIAEAWSKRRYPKHFVSKLTDADAELRETQHWLETVLDCEYVSYDEGKAIIDQLDRIGRMLITMICKANRFRIT